MNATSATDLVAIRDFARTLRLGTFRRVRADLCRLGYLVPGDPDVIAPLGQRLLGFVDDPKRIDRRLLALTAEGRTLVRRHYVAGELTTEVKIGTTNWSRW
jgi:DNA-binding transcriptional MocR family regulator